MKKELVSELTRQELAAALFAFMRKKPLDKISVKEVSESCGVPRSTFYYHFEDIYDLASWALSHRLLECLGESGDCFLWGDGVLTLFQRCKEHREVCRCAVDSIHVWQMAKSYCDRCMDGIMVGMRKLDGDRNTDPEFLRFLALFYGHAVLSTLINWFRGDMKETPEAMADAVDFIVKDGIVAALDRAQGKRGASPA